MMKIKLTDLRTYYINLHQDKKRGSATKKLLESLGFKDFHIVMALQNSRRIIINDYNNANPFPRAEAINIKRDADNLGDYL